MAAKGDTDSPDTPHRRAEILEASAGPRHLPAFPPQSPRRQGAAGGEAGAWFAFYALSLAERHRGSPAFPNGFDLTIRPHRLAEPFKLKAPDRAGAQGTRRHRSRNAREGKPGGQGGSPPSRRQATKSISKLRGNEFARDRVEE